MSLRTAKRSEAWEGGFGGKPGREAKAGQQAKGTTDDGGGAENVEKPRGFVHFRTWGVGWRKRGARWRQDDEERGPRWPKMAPRWSQEGPKGPQEGPKRVPGGFQEGPRWPQEGPKRAQDESKMAQIGARSAQDDQGGRA